AVGSADVGQQAGDAQHGVVGDGGGYHDYAGHDGTVFGEHLDRDAGHELQHAARGEEAHQEAGGVADPGLLHKQHGDQGDNADGGVDDQYLAGLEPLGQQRGVDEQGQYDAYGVQGLDAA